MIYQDTTSGLVHSRLRDMLARPNHASLTPDSPARSDVLAAEKQIKNLTHFALPTLPHLMALLAHPSDAFPPSNTSLLVVDNISTLFALAFPKLTEDAHKQQPQAKKYDASQFASNRRWAVMADLISRLGRLAVTRNIAILLLGQTTTRVRSDTGAVLCPAISGTGWDGGINSRIVLYRDWLFLSKDPSSQAENCPGVRFAGIMKAKGIPYQDLGRIVAFTIIEVIGSMQQDASDCPPCTDISQAGLQEVKLDKSQLRCQITAETMATNPKRKRDEIADSESEDEDARSDREFGWGAEDETLQAEHLL